MYHLKSKLVDWIFCTIHTTYASSKFENTVEHPFFTKNVTLNMKQLFSIFLLVFLLVFHQFHNLPQ